MPERFAKNKASEILLKVCYFPFVVIGGITMTFYDVARMEEHPVAVFVPVVGLLHAALWAFWAFVFKRVLAGSLEQMSFSKGIATAGIFIAYVVGLFIGWMVHKYS